MKIIKRVFVVLFLVSVALAQSQQEPPISDTRLPVHTLVREDIFAGFLADDMDRFSRGEKNVDLLLEKRPGSKSDLLAWKGSATYYRAIRALDKKDRAEFDKLYRQSLDFFAQARQAGPGNPGVDAILGGTNVVFADRLPKEYQAAAWKAAYESYQTLWKYQGQMVDRLPLHLRGELLSGLTQSAQRTGRTEEMQQYLDKMLTLLRDTPYEPVARKWKENPQAAAGSSLACMSCHDEGRLKARMTALSGK